MRDHGRTQASKSDGKGSRLDVETQAEKLDPTPYFSRAPLYPPIICECSVHSELCGSPESGSVTKFISASIKLGFVEHFFPLSIRSIGQVSILVEPVPSSASGNKLNTGWRVRDSGRASHTVSAINMVERVYLLLPVEISPGGRMGCGRPDTKEDECAILEGTERKAVRVPCHDFLVIGRHPGLGYHIYSNAVRFIVTCPSSFRSMPTATSSPCCQSRLQSHFCTTVPPLLNSDISPRTFPISFNSALGNVVINANSRPWLWLARTKS